MNDMKSLMDETLVRVNTPRKRSSFGKRDIRRLHRQARRVGQTACSMKEWARLYGATIRSDAGRPLSALAKKLLTEGPRY